MTAALRSALSHLPTTSALAMWTASLLVWLLYELYFKTERKNRGVALIDSDFLYSSGRNLTFLKQIVNSWLVKLSEFVPELQLL